MKTLRISPDLALPLDFVTQATAIVAKRRVGKSYTARRLTEQVVRAGVQTIIIDPKGDWWGSRSSADGRSEGLPLTIFGGEHQDVPLTATSGELLAGIAVEEQVSMIVDLSEFRKHEIPTFTAPFLEQLYRLKAREAYRTPLLLLVDEGDAIAPQKPQPNEARMLGAAEDIVRRGGQRGIGSVFITQRTAVLNKNVLTQAQVLIALRTIAPQDLAAMNAWIDVHGEPAQRKTLMGSLPSLPVGEAWVWSPGWPTDDGIFQRVKVDRIETFDSGATPKPGETRIAPKVLAAVDRDRIRDLMAHAVEVSEANDPKALRARVAELEKELAERPEPERIEVPCTDITVVSAISRARVRLEEMRAQLDEAVTDIGAALSYAEKRPALPPALTPDGRRYSIGAPPESIQPRAALTLRQKTAGARRHPEAANAPRARKGDGVMKPHTPFGSTPTIPPEGWTMEEEQLYQKFKARLLEEAPALVQVLATAPELEVTVERRVVEIDGSTMKGRLARLLADGFLDSGKRNGELVKELGRTGTQVHPARVSEALSEFVVMRLIERDGGDRYRKAEGAKVTKRTVESGG